VDWRAEFGQVRRVIDHFQVFAADTSLNLDPGATAAEVLAALEGHVVARGELIGTFRAA
jgi:phosphatidylethanolamine-binding protein (PEBP) family uncharacterized protein